MNTPRPRGPARIGRNAVLNLSGHALPLVVGVFTIPFIVRRLGLDAFGVLSLAWALLGYLGFFDLGLGRATTNALAKELDRGNHAALPRLFWASLKLSLLLGLVAGGVLAALSDLLVRSVLRLPPALIEDAGFTFLLLSASLPPVLASTMLRGVLEAAQRFDLINAIRIPANASLFVLPAAALAVGSGLPGIAALLACASALTFVAYMVACVCAIPAVRARQPLNRALAKSLLSYGGWVTAGNALGPLIVYLDRFLIGALVSTTAVAFYAAPYEIVTRLWVFPASLVSALFPLFSVSHATRVQNQLQNLYMRPITYLVLTVGSGAVLLIIFADPVLRLWLGPAFAEQAAWALRILAAGVLVNSVAHVPYSLIQALGRPDLVAKLYVVELVAYVGVAWPLIARWGITGAAWAWTIRALADAVALFVLAWRLCPFKWMDVVRGGPVRGVTALCGLGVSTALAVRLIVPGIVSAQLLVTAALVSGFALCAWKWVLSAPKWRPMPGGSVDRIESKSV
jgi:O-antigen/teichoic acid export membrane protein